MRCVYSLVILVLGLSQFTAMGRSVRPFKDVKFKINESQNLIRESGIQLQSGTIGSYQRINLAISELKDTEACRNNVNQCNAFGEKAVNVFNVLGKANQSTTSNHIAGAIAGRTAEIFKEWDPSAKEGAGVWMDGFVGAKGPLSVKTNKAVEDLLKHQGNTDVLSESEKDMAIRGKRRELERNCRYS